MSLRCGSCARSMGSCRVVVVVFQQPAQPFTALNRACALCVVADRRKEQHIALALMIPLVMKMRHVLCQHMPERRFPKQNQPREALLLDGSHPPLRIGVQIRGPRWQRDSRDPGRVDELLKGGAVFPILV